MNLILWRHADAEDGSEDLTRALTRKGQQQARLMAAWLRERLAEHAIVLASDAKRSKQTAACLSKGFRVESQLNPGASLETVLDVLAPYQEHDTVVLVGHQPYLGCLAARLMSGDPQYWAVKKGAIWWLAWRQLIDDEPVRLKAMMTPAMLAGKDVHH